MEDSMEHLGGQSCKRLERLFDGQFWYMILPWRQSPRLAKLRSCRECHEGVSCKRECRRKVSEDFISCMYHLLSCSAAQPQLHHIMHMTSFAVWVVSTEHTLPSQTVLPLGRKSWFSPWTAVDHTRFCHKEGKPESPKSCHTCSLWFMNEPHERGQMSCHSLTCSDSVLMHTNLNWWLIFKAQFI